MSGFERFKRYGDIDITVLLGTVHELRSGRRCSIAAEKRSEVARDV